MDRIWIVKRVSYFKLCLLNGVHGKLALGPAQAHLDTLKPVIDDDDSLVPKKSKLKCGGRDAIFPDTTGGFAYCLPNHVSQLWRDCSNAIRVLTQIRLFLPLVSLDHYTGISRREGLRDPGRIFAGRAQ